MVGSRTTLPAPGDDTLLLLKGRLKRRNGVRVFLCDWAAGF